MDKAGPSQTGLYSEGLTESVHTILRCEKSVKMSFL